MRAADVARQGFEALMSGKTPASGSIQGNLLSLEANYAGGQETPYLLLDMMNGYPNELLESYDVKQASLTEGEAIGIWDKVSRSLSRTSERLLTVTVDFRLLRR